jgi:hypothetical protein
MPAIDLVDPDDLLAISGEVVTGVLAEVVDPFRLVWFDSSTDTWGLLDPAANADRRIGLTLSGGAAGQTIAIATGREVVLEVGDILTVPDVLCASNTVDGEIVPMSDLIAGDSVYFVGYTTADSRLVLMLKNPDFSIPGS